jgi:hypothetical protein
VSTKIYDAYRVKDRDRVWRVVEDIRERGEKAVILRLAKYYRDFVDNIDPEDASYKAERAKDQVHDYPEHVTRLQLAQTALRDGFQKSATSVHRSFFDPDVNVALTWHATGFYLRVFCDRASLLGGALDFVRTHPDLEDFHYQNQSDPPSGVQPEEYEARARIWDEMSTPPGSGLFQNQLILEISSWGKFWHLDPWLDLTREFHQSPPTYPIREELFARRLRRLEAFGVVKAEPNQISGTTKDGVIVTIAKRGKICKSRVGDRVERHVTIDNAVNWVEYLHLPEYLRRRIDSEAPGVIERNLVRKKP